jgi:carboxylesterase
MPSDSSRAPLACLLVHGLNGSPHDLQDLAAHLRQFDIAAETLLLPGHDIHHRQAAHFGWGDWLHAVTTRFTELAQRHEHVAIVGHSLGGALALSVAAHEPRVAAIATLCAPAELHHGLSSIVGVGRHLTPYVPVFREDISDRLERRAYRRRKVTNWMPMAPLQTLLQALPILRTNLDAVTCPALIVAARRDHVVPMRDGVFLHKNIASTDKELIILDHSWHVVTRDVEREAVATHVTSFLLRVGGMA